MAMKSRSDEESAPRPAPVISRAAPLVAVGDTLRELRVLSDIDWGAIPEDKRPAPAERFEGLGWVVAAVPGRPPASL